MKKKDIFYYEKGLIKENFEQKCKNDVFYYENGCIKKL